MDKKLIESILNNLKEDKVKYQLNSKVLVIDGLNCFLRAFSIVNQFNKDNNHIGGMIGFLKSIGYAIKLVNPTRTIIVFDGPGGSASKKNLYPDYKANRNTGRVTNYHIFQGDKEGENEAIGNQMTRLIQYLHCLPLDILCIDALEADDVMGHLVEEFEQNTETNEITLMSADQDFLQLVSSKTQVYSPTKKKFYQTDKVLDEYKVHPNNFLIMKTLMGDDSDNLPGIDGLGPKKFDKLFGEYLNTKNKFSLNDVFNLAESNQEQNKLCGKILERKNQMEINYQLMNLRDIPLSNENKNIIKQTLHKNINLDKLTFITMYNSDNLAESIPNVHYWVNQCFSTLQSYRTI